MKKQKLRTIFSDECTQEKPSPYIISHICGENKKGQMFKRCTTATNSCFHNNLIILNSLSIFFFKNNTINSDLSRRHIPFLSVRETLEFARDCTQGLRPENFTPQMRKFFAYALVEGQDPFLEYVMQILDLKKIENFRVSGISDTDRDKLTIAELAVGTYSVMVYDQPLTGSDPAMTYDLVNTIRAVCRVQQSSAIMALNHLSEEAFDLFDRIILLGEGHLLYQGPRQDAVTYFAQLG